ncbi:tyrosine--tRNA ligase, mitochondrial-like [Mizuhopecten yessoensis]|uniref:Tyrosine--tRNA ligase n=1 Tax=Mizuhopecten yessoensis TaxID=6573 RepID=A0A210Q6A2_MIZYE|nr:tyrosine--tRNA ligase, mitochondrial-like [Mizuhopecten yessoensis]OWF44251.1 tyrosine--tRNA ligase, mitochondrial [Mizuhopecten yessoensis]
MAAPMSWSMKKYCIYAFRYHIRCLRVVGAGRSVHLPNSRTYSAKAPRNILSLHDRGIFQNVYPSGSTPELVKRLSKPVTVYCGFDPTAESLHIGNLLAVVALLHCQRGGHNPIGLIGGATAMVGDPSGKTKDRNPMNVAEVEKNMESIAKSLQRIFDNHSQYMWKEDRELPPLQILNNADWYRDINVISFLATVGRRFRLGQMLSRQSVSARLKSSEGMSFTEFSYQILQSYDWLHLCRNHKCSIQIGGNDQLGNITSGFDLICAETEERVWGLTVPLITTAGGEKIGKTAGNALWLNPDQTSPFHFYQFFINRTDNEVEKYLKLFTFMSDDQISAAMKKHNNCLDKRHGQNLLAEQVTLLVHGEAGLEQAKRWTLAFYSGTTDSLTALSLEELQQLFKNVVTVPMLLDPGLTVREMCMKAQIFDREVDADRTINEGGLYINHCRTYTPDLVLLPRQHILTNDITLVRLGKKKHFIIRWLTP